MYVCIYIYLIKNIKFTCFILDYKRPYKLIRINITIYKVNT